MATDFQRQPRKKYCQLCKDDVKFIDYKDVALLRKYMTDRGKIKPRRVTGACRQHQHEVAVAIKRAREMALVPYTVTVVSGSRDRRLSPAASPAPAGSTSMRSLSLSSVPVRWLSCPTPSRL